MIGVLGGTFDPIHFGHLRTALELREGLGLEQVRIIPCREPPHREAPVASPEARLAMAKLGIAGQSGLIVDEREMDREGPSYMVDTLATLTTDFPGTGIGLILGTDAFLGLPDWHRWREILDLAHLLVVQRPGWSPPRTGIVADLLAKRRCESRAQMEEPGAGGILLCTVTRLEIAATAIRAQLAAGKSARFLLPDPVLAYIRAHRAYSPSRA